MKLKSLVGSSPRGRGKLVIHTLTQINEGLIPAWAGKTAARRPRRERTRAHPRVGGENKDRPQTT